ncbi:MAG TPA: TolC family protein, partial [Archangium sp.]|uniref:TolC family protein n=1 Tax=Archangium sp. TaxID=1872627 RepID=UPI002ED7EC45
ALRTASERQPQLRQAQASTEAARARVDQSRAGLLPQVNANAGYQVSTARDTGTTPVDGSTNFRRGSGFTVGATASQLLWDFGQTTGRYRAARESADAQAATAFQTRLDVLTEVSTAYFNVLAQQALVDVARETLENEVAHLRQVEAQVQVGTRAEIDLLQQPWRAGRISPRASGRCVPSSNRCRRRGAGTGPASRPR